MNFYEWFFEEKGREPAGLFSFGHLFSVTLTLLIFLALAIFLGKRFKGDEKKTNLVLLISAIAIVSLQIAKITYLLITTDNIVDCLIGNAPLYFCDIMIIMIPLAALTRGRFRDCCLDFVAVCGLLMGFMGNYFAGNLYPSHAVISWAAMVALLNHSISAFASMFVWAAKLNKMEKRNILIVISFLFIFMTFALIMAYAFDKNFMFYFHGDGTPFTIFDEHLSFGLKPIYQIWIYVLQCGYMGLFYVIYYLIIKWNNKLKDKKANVQQKQ
jgi:hypothetical protein